ncbi:MAG: helix-turn-helix transcriptional regulator, partial [Kiritimatiellales bacterium]|nr:helix-turn-helix transcriptional regulator [Kiritimatiellales bacterium]
MTTSVKTPKSTIKKLRDELQVTRKTFCRLLPVSERLLADLETDKRVPSETVTREFKELKRLVTALKGVIDPDHLAEWLGTPNAAFGELKP